MTRSLLLSLVALLPTAALAQTGLLAGASSALPAPLVESVIGVDESALAEALEALASSTATRAAERRTLRLGGAYTLADGPLTVEVLDGFGRSCLRLGAAAMNAADGLRLPAPALSAGTYQVRIFDARGQELHRQRVVYRPQ